MYKLKLKLTNEQTNNILQFVDEYYFSDYFKNNICGTGRRYCLMNRNVIMSNFSKSIMKEKYQELEIFDMEDEPFFGVFLGTGIEGSFVHEHRDFAPKGYNHIRLNFLLSKPEIGGNPIIEDEEIEIQEGESWINIADLWRHRSSVVKGNKKRIVLSIGALVPVKTVEEKLKKYYTKEL